MLVLYLVDSIPGILWILPPKYPPFIRDPDQIFFCHCTCYSSKLCCSSEPCWNCGYCMNDTIAVRRSRKGRKCSYQPLHRFEILRPFCNGEENLQLSLEVGAAEAKAIEVDILNISFQRTDWFQVDWRAHCCKAGCPGSASHLSAFLSFSSYIPSALTRWSSSWYSEVLSCPFWTRHHGPSLTAQ